jgi:prevent-host-death family protein
MAVVGVKELKNRLTEYLRRTRQGDEIIVTDRGRPIAVIQPLNQAAQLSSLEARLARLDAQGIAAAPARLPLRRVRRSRAKGRLLSRVVIDDRR